MIIIPLVSNERGVPPVENSKESRGALFGVSADSLLYISLRCSQHFADPSEALFVLSDDPGEVHRNIFWLDAELFLALGARNEKHEFGFFHNFIASCN